MTDKTFYQAAADEVASGHLDDALWIKVCAEMPEAAPKAQQAKYIALRAQEIGTDYARRRFSAWMPHTMGGWFAYFLTLAVIAFVAAVPAKAIAPGEFLDAIVFVLVVLAGLCVPFVVRNRTERLKQGGSD